MGAFQVEREDVVQDGGLGLGHFAQVLGDQVFADFGHRAVVLRKF